jgi:zinc protease
MFLRTPMPWLAAASVLALAVPFLARAQSGPKPPSRRVFPYPIREAVLDNGLRVIAVPMDTPGILAHYVVVRAGSRNEVEAGLSGFAHFFEHMMFRGTDRFPAERYNDALKRIGADSNAFTTDDWTCYHVTASARALAAIMDLEADRFMNLKYTVEAFQKEAGAVLGEYNKSISAPFMSIHERLRETAFDRHTYKHTTMGFLKDIQDMPNRYEYSLTFFRRWYRPDNCVLVVAGDVAPENVFDLAKKYYGPWQRGAASLQVEADPAQTAERGARIAWKNPTLPYLVLAWRVPAFDAGSAEDRALDVLATAAFSETSPLYKDLVLERQWVEVLRGSHEAHRDPYLFSVVVRIKDASKVDGVREAIEMEISRLAREPLPAARLDAVKSNLRYDFLRGLETPDGVAQTIGDFTQLTGDPASLETSFSALDAVGPEDVLAAAAKFFAPESRTVLTLVHEKEAR